MKIRLRGRSRRVTVALGKDADRACTRNAQLSFGKKRGQAPKSYRIRSLTADIISIFRFVGLGKKK